jgi:transposase InsO family protein
MHPRRPGLVIFDQILERTSFALEMALRSTLVILIAGSESIAVFILQHRTDNGPEFVAKAVQEWIAAAGAKTAYIERGSPFRSRASTPAFAMSCSTARSSAFCARPRSKSRAGDSLQRDQAPRLNRIQATSTRGILAFIRRVAGCATPTCGTTQRGLTISAWDRRPRGSIER